MNAGVADTKINYDAPASVVLVSAYGRAHWLAAELTGAGFRVDLVDVTDELGRWTPEDVDGPFGFFQPENLLPLQRVRLDEEDYSENVEEGFVLWLKSGPVDMRGPNSSYLLERRGVSKEDLEYVTHYAELPAKKRTELFKKLNKKSFLQNWLAQLAHSLAGRVYLPSPRAMEQGEPLPMMAPLSVRRVTRRGFEKSMNWLRSRGVRVYEKAKIKDLTIDEGTLANVEIQSEWSGVLQAEQFVWCLTSLETERLGANYLFELFDSEVIHPAWVWQRFRIDLQEPLRSESLPLKWAMLEDITLPWTHTNLLLAQKTVAKDTVDVWARLPAVHRFQKGYLEEVGREICEQFAARVPGAQPKIVDYPQEYHYDERVLGPALFACVDGDHLEKLDRRNLKNLHFDGPENWKNLEWTGQFQEQKNIYQELMAWKLERDKRMEKLKAKEMKEAQKEAEKAARNDGRNEVEK